MQNSIDGAVDIFNPLARNATSWFRIPVQNKNFHVVDFDLDRSIPSQCIEVKQETRNIPERNTTANYEVVFQVNLGPFERKAFLITNTTQALAVHSTESEENSIANSQLQLKFDSNGNLYEIDNFASNISSRIYQNFCFYKSQTGNLKF